MRARRSYSSYQQFRNELLSSTATISSAVEDAADDMFHAGATEEFDKMWDSVDDSEEP